MRGATDHVVVVALGAALTYATLAQGAYYASGLVPVLFLVGLALTAWAFHPWGTADRAVGFTAAAFCAFALWVLALGWWHADLAAAVPAAALAAGLAAAGLAASGLSASSRQVLQLVMIGLGVVVAGSAWVGVVLRVEPLALPSSDLWRGASTLTYANATAAFLVVTVILAVAVLPTRRLSNAVLAVLLVGLLVTMSRAGALGFAVALVAFATLAPDRSRLRAALPALPAAAVAGLALVPSLPTAAPARPLVALAGVLVGGVVLVTAPRLRARHPAVPAALLTALAVVAIALPWAPNNTGDAAGDLAATRLTALSAERDDLTRVTAEQFRSAPVTGVGPGGLDLRYIDHTGTPVRAVYTHNEYLQTAAETGVVGAGMLLVGLGALAVAGTRTRTHEGAAAAAVVAGFAVHSAFDYLWHIPVLPLLLTLTVVALTATPVRSPNRKEPTFP